MVDFVINFEMFVGLFDEIVNYGEFKFIVFVGFFGGKEGFKGVLLYFWYYVGVGIGYGN